MNNRKRGLEKFMAAVIAAAAISWGAAGALLLATPADAAVSSCIEDCEGCTDCVWCGRTQSGTDCYRKATEN